MIVGGAAATAQAGPQRPHNAVLAVPRAVERATSELATGPTHLASRGGNIAPRARHLGEQLVVTVTLGRAAVVVVAPARRCNHRASAAHTA